MYDLKGWSTIILLGGFGTKYCFKRIKGRVIVFNATFNDISVITWPSVLLVEETGVPTENH